MNWSKKMARTGSQTNPRTYAISCGFLIGPAHTHKLRELLEAKGFTQAPPEAADIIIAHSAGCYLTPKQAAARLVIFVGMPIAQEHPARTWWQVNWKNTVTFSESRKVSSWLAAVLFNVYYAIVQPKRNLSIIRHIRHSKPNLLPRASYVFIANRHDLWTQSAMLDNLLETKDWAFIGLPGLHNDIWEHPERYASIIEYYARLLA